eukprot:scaffold1923_cov160-Amphora_coffeaeformis.AAC.13
MSKVVYLCERLFRNDCELDVRVSVTDADLPRARSTGPTIPYTIFIYLWRRGRHKANGDCLDHT